MTYLDELAAEIKRQVPSDLLPGENTGTLFRIHAVLALAKGIWRSNCGRRAQRMGGVGHQQDRGHRSIKPFEELDEDAQASDEPFVKAIRAVAVQHLNLGSR